MAGAIGVASFYIGEHVRLTGAGVEEKNLRHMRLLQGWIEERRQVKHKDLLQRAPNPVRQLKADGIKPLLNELTERGYIRQSGELREARP